MALPPIPDSLKPIKMLMRCAEQHDTRDPVVAYYCRLCAFQKGHSLDSSSPDARTFLTRLITQLEMTKAHNQSIEGITTEMIGLAHLESYAMKLFSFAYHKDLNGDFSKPTLQSFLTSGALLEVVTTLGQPLEELEKAKKYAKWKSVYLAKCQQTGETPQPGPAVGTDSADVPAFALLEQPTPLAPATPNTQPGLAPATQPVPSTPSTGDSGQIESEYIDPKTYQAVEKHLKYALSALQHHDRATVKSYLEQAIKELK